MNNFGAEEHLKLTTALFENLFPAINVHSVSLKQCKDSEGEDAAESRVTLAEDVGGGNLASRQSRVKLQEVARVEGGCGGVQALTSAS
ncbi:hypothetical protein WJX82_010564 [Trebouxia sp. C0006]